MFLFGVEAFAFGFSGLRGLGAQGLIVFRDFGAEGKKGKDAKL